MISKLLVLSMQFMMAVLVASQETDFTCEKQGYFAANNCEDYYFCAKLSSGDFYVIEYTCPQGKLFSNPAQQCVPSEKFSCDSNNSNPGDEPILGDDFVCTSAGRFPDTTSMDCKKYYTCTFDGTQLNAILRSCPGTLIFSWDTSNCVAPGAFICPDLSTTTTDSSTSTSTEMTTSTTPETSSSSTVEVTKTTTPVIVSSTTTLTTTTDSGEFICSKSGYFPLPDCSTYIYCLKPVYGSFKQFTFRCLPGYKFNPTLATCQPNYSCS
ncbi:uncharacterized protein LOC129740385 [Uranotaenia lowii]|uniref:uncharacterized protein LOC129740385 n=1 Tax=Uranotaenia lowii TaxID=190385 RepID=UPI00247AF240|nr:uncharacterized protein LOC129740385 [Uranotaenia lowii]